MAFNFNWSGFSEELYDQTKQILNNALNKGPRPDVVADRIEVHELNFGSIAPELELLEIGDLAEDKFRGMLKLTYEGDAYLVLRTQVQVNPVKIKSEISIQASRGMLAAHQPLIVPMLLRISHLRLRGIISLVVSPHSGITLVFKNDPLQGVEVSSTFDDLGSVKTFLQEQIEETLSTMFQEDLPRIIHSFSDRLRPKTPPRPSQPKQPPSFSPISPTPTLCSDNLPRSHSPEPFSFPNDTVSLPDIPTLTNMSAKCGMGSIGLGVFQSPPMPGLPRRNFSFNQLPAMAKKAPSHSPGDSEYPSSHYSPPSSRRNTRTSSNHPPPVFHRVGPIPISRATLEPEKGLRGLLDKLPKTASSALPRSLSLGPHHS